MTLFWKFTQKAKDEKTRNPVSGEFFAQDAIRNAGEALVREAIQNSLDARPDRQNGKVKVRIYVSGPSTHLKPELHNKWFGSAWNHYLAPKNGLRHGSINRSNPCSYLVFEDFGTSGLTGNWKQVDQIDGVRNSFFYFFRAEGATEKSSDQLGRWGIGKQVFPRSSNAQTLFGFSITDEHPNGFLLGSCILKYHEVEGRVYRPDGYFGATLDVGDGQYISIPTQDKNLLDSFRADFNLQRLSGQNGLSIVVPWLDDGEDGINGFNTDSLLSAIIDGYFLPIMEGKLEVELEDEHHSIRIKSDNLTKVLEDLLCNSSKEDERRNKCLRRTKALVDLVTESKNDRPLIFELKPCPAAKTGWNDDMLLEETSRSIRTALTDGRTVKVKATLTIRPKIGEAVQDTFWCIIRKHEGLNERPCHIREDLIISSVSAGRTNGYVAVVRIDKGALANLLGDSENPAHTEWQTSSQNFKDKYILGGLIIKFVSDFPAELLRHIFNSTDQLDKDVLRRWFNDPDPEREGKHRPRTMPNGPPITPPIAPPEMPDINPTQNPIQITPQKDGFTVSTTEIKLPKGTRIEILAAYETAKGNPFSAYKPYDFDFASKHIKLTDCIIVEAKQKKLIIETKSALFSVTASGFDVNRDLIVSAKAIKTKDLT
jgi:hypothetical protein